jgi:hypothetical protein
MKSKIHNKMKIKGKENISQSLLYKLTFHYLKKSQCTTEFGTRDQLKRHLMLKHYDTELEKYTHSMTNQCPQKFIESKIKLKTTFNKENQGLNEINNLHNTYQSLNSDLEHINEMIVQHGFTMKRIENNNYFSQTDPKIFERKETPTFDIQNTTHQLNFIPKKIKLHVPEKIIQPLQLIDPNINTKNHKQLKKLNLKKINRDEKENSSVITPNSMSLRLNNVDKDLRGLLTEGKELKHLVEKKDDDDEENISANLSFQTNNGLISARDPFEEKERDREDLDIGLESETLEEINVNLDILNKEDSFSGKKTDGNVSKERDTSELQKTSSNLFKEMEEDFVTDKPKVIKLENDQKESLSNKNTDFHLKSLNEINSEFFAERNNAEKKMLDTLQLHLKKGLETKIEKKQTQISNLKKKMQNKLENRNINPSDKSMNFGNQEEVDVSMLSLFDDTDLLKESLTDIEFVLKKAKSNNIKKKQLLNEMVKTNNHLYGNEFDLKNII